MATREIEKKIKKGGKREESVLESPFHGGYKDGTRQRGPIENGGRELSKRTRQKGNEALLRDS